MKILQNNPTICLTKSIWKLPERECIGDHKSVLLDADVPAPSRTSPMRYRCKTTRGVMGLHELMSAIISQVIRTSRRTIRDDLHAKQRAARLEGRAMMGRPQAGHLLMTPTSTRSQGLSDHRWLMSVERRAVYYLAYQVMTGLAP